MPKEYERTRGRLPSEHYGWRDPQPPENDGGNEWELVCALVDKRKPPEENIVWWFWQREQTPREKGNPCGYDAAEFLCYVNDDGLEYTAENRTLRDGKLEAMRKEYAVAGKRFLAALIEAGQVEFDAEVAAAAEAKR